MNNRSYKYAIEKLTAIDLVNKSRIIVSTLNYLKQQDSATDNTFLDLVDKYAIIEAELSRRNSPSRNGQGRIASAIH